MRRYMVDEFVISSRQLITQTAPFYRVIFELNEYLISAQRTFQKSRSQSTVFLIAEASLTSFEKRKMITN